jgi:MATE family multidrug resistance protein
MKSGTHSASNTSYIPIKAFMKSFSSAAIPFSLNSLVAIVSIIVGTCFIAHVGTSYLSASALMLVIQSAIVTTLSGILFATGVYAGISQGKNTPQNVGKYFRQSIILAVTLGLFGMIVMLLAKYYLSWVHQPLRLIVIAEQFFKGYFLTIPAILILTCETQIALSAGKSQIILAVTCFNTAINIMLAFILIFGIGPIPSFKAFGYGLANTISSWFTLVAFTFYIFKHKSFQKFQLFRCDFSDPEKIRRQLFKTGLPIGIELGIEQITLAGITFLIGFFGLSALGAHQTVMQYVCLFTVIIYSASHAASVIVGQFTGAQSFHHAKRFGNMSILVVSLFALVGFLIFAVFSNILPAIFFNTKNHLIMLQLAKQIFYMQGLTLIFDAFRHAPAGALRGYTETITAMYTSLACTVISLLLAAIGILWFSFPIAFIFISRIVGLIIASSFLYRRWLWVSKKSIFIA